MDKMALNIFFVLYLVMKELKQPDFFFERMSKENEEGKRQ
jgi:hypothetical protein